MEERISVSKSELKAVITEVLAEMLGLSIPQPDREASRQWYDTSPAFVYLELDSPEILRDMVRNGLLRIGSEVRDIRAVGSEKPRYQFHVTKCQQRLTEVPERRSRKRSGKQNVA